MDQAKFAQKSDTTIGSDVNTNSNGCTDTTAIVNTAALFPPLEQWDIHAHYCDKEYWDRLYDYCSRKNAQAEEEETVKRTAMKKVHEEMPQITEVGEDGQFNNDQQHFEWFCCYEDIRVMMETKWQQIFGPNKDIPILEIGCGISDLASNLVIESKYNNITCIDFSARAINLVKLLNFKKFADPVRYPFQTNANITRLQTCIQYLCQDARFLDFPDNTFQVVYFMTTIKLKARVAKKKKKKNRIEIRYFFFFSFLLIFLANFFLPPLPQCCNYPFHLFKLKEKFFYDMPRFTTGLFVIITSRSSNKRLEFVSELKLEPNHCVFTKIFDEKIDTELRDFRDGQKKTVRLIMLQAQKKTQFRSASP
ncbi:hypothetical protein RFI_11466 [Reticulomyxa filosa]|uniref:Methyltransferase type 11 domain-containing protein n=1 Tax=Reticulomyxa filosa TaxID=46433 RepID=X6NI38_RETFI|nr:hypothetical protein RFI_11466 [Reticulomyxa filosa]|eukprot:ETO25671.1 hypothetical protein RFI_11466 [Reticulomyxa filosa]